MVIAGIITLTPAGVALVGAILVFVFILGYLFGEVSR